MAKKPSLADLSTKRTPAADQAAPATSAQNSTGTARRAGSQPDGRKGILIRVEVAGWRQLRDLAAEMTETTGDQVSMQSLIVDQINRLLKEHGRPPVA